MVNYSLIFTNNKQNTVNDIDKYLCSDYKVHIRFRDFNKEELLIGFEKKLTYLVSYLVNYSYIPKLLSRYENEEILMNFLLYDDILKIIDFITNSISDDRVEFKGLVIKPNYKKQQDNYKYFGDTDAKFFPLHIKNNLIKTGSLKFFLDTFNLDLYNYLFDDNYIIWLHNKQFKASRKFEIRKLKKANKQNNKAINVVELW